MKKSLNNNIAELFDSGGNSIVSQIINQAENSKNPVSFYIAGDDCSQTWEQFRNCFTEIPAAGGLVVNSDRMLLFIFRFGHWDLPKGKIERDETPELAAVREVEEECGISGPKIIRQLEPTFHIYRSPFLPVEKNLVLKETKWFLMEYAGNQNPVPQTEENIVEIRWFDIKDIDRVYQNTYSSIRDFLDKSLPTI